MSFMTLSKPDKFDDHRDALAVRACLYYVKKYLCLVQIGQDVEIDTRTAVDFASSYKLVVKVGARKKGSADLGSLKVLCRESVCP